jgi:hypothetical protein
LGFASCEIEPEVNIPNIAQQIVVDGWIEHGSFAQVLLTYNSPYFANLDSASFRALVASRAKVSVSDGTSTEILTLTKDTNFFPPFIYRGREIRGESGKSYTLLVEDEIDTVTSSTTIPFAAIPDSLWFEYKQGNDTLGFIKGTMAVKEGETHYYRAFTRMANASNKKRYYPALVALFNDSWVSGETFTFSIKKGPESYLKPQHNIYFKKGDTIIVRITTVDEISYSFWTGYHAEVANSGNPFAANHAKIESNIKNGLGVWCGYGAIYMAVIAK